MVPVTPVKVSASPETQTGRKPASDNPLDIDGSKFDSEAYLSKLLKEKGLPELMNSEHEMVQQVRSLDSEMQTLVYENYAKFITATDTIRKMRTDFAKMEDEMDRLAENMEKITQFSEQVCGSLQGRREDITKLVEANSTLKKLEDILDLPVQLSDFVERKEFSAAVQAYGKMCPVLEQYKDYPAFQGIYGECVAILADIKDQLKDEFRSKISTAQDLAVAFSLLLQLGEASQALSEEYLEHSETHLRKDLAELEAQVCLKAGETPEKRPGSAGSQQRPSDAIPSLPIDVLEFVDLAANGFLANTSLVMTTYLDMFVHRKVDGVDDSKALKRAYGFINKLMGDFFVLTKKRFNGENGAEDSSLLVRALDRFYRRLQALSKIIPDADFSESSLRIISEVANHQVDLCLERLKQQLQNYLTDIRQQLAVPRTLIHRDNQPLAELLSKLEQGVVQNLKTALANLLQLTAYDITFGNIESFVKPFGVYVRERLLVAYFTHIVDMCADFCEGRSDKAFVTSTVILLLSRFCIHLGTSTIGYLLDLCEQQFRLQSGEGAKRIARQLTPSATLSTKIRNTAQQLIDHYVEKEGFALSQMLSKSVETRDWVTCLEPRSVRAVMKRVVEDLTAIEGRVGQLYEEGAKKDRSSDSTRRSTGLHSLSSRQTLPRGQWTPSVTASSENPLLRKLWSEKVDYFASVEFTKVSVLTGIVKICLKTLLECLRLKTFGRYGLQQVQVDCHYLQLYLWRFVSDENLVHHLLEEIMTSTALRCLDTTLMEPSVVEIICERG